MVNYTEDMFFNIDELADEILGKLIEFDEFEEVSVFGNYEYIVELIEVLVREGIMLEDVVIKQHTDCTYMLILTDDGITVRPYEVSKSHKYSCKNVYIHEDVPAKVFDSIFSNNITMFSIAIYDDEEFLEEFDNIMFDDEDDDLDCDDCPDRDACERFHEDDSEHYYLDGKEVSKEEFIEAEELLEKLKTLISARYK